MSCDPNWTSRDGLPRKAQLHVRSSRSDARSTKFNEICCSFAQIPTQPPALHIDNVLGICEVPPFGRLLLYFGN